MQRHEPPIRRTVRRWASASNRRRGAEELASGLALVLASAIVGLGILRVPAALQHLGWSRTDAWPSDRTLLLASAIVVGGTFVVAVVRALVRYRRRRIGELALARKLDEKHATADLLATAIAVESGNASGNAELSVAVAQRAEKWLPSLGKPVPRFREPVTPLAAVGIAAALVASIPFAVEGEADAADDAASADDAIATPPLDAETLERLQEAAQQLARFEHKPGLKDSAREKLAEVRRQLDAIEADPDRSLSTLSKAEQALRELAEQSRSKDLFDPEKLGGMTSEELAEQMTRSLERGETDTAAAMAEEMARRLEDADEREMRSMAKALERALERTPPSSRSSPEGTESPSGSESGKAESAESGKPESEAGKSGAESGESGSQSGESGKSGAESGKSESGESGKSGAESGKSGAESGESESSSSKSGSQSGGAESSRSSPGAEGSGSERREAEDRARWRNKAEGLSERLRSGDSGTARSELEKMAEEMGKRAGQESMSRSLDRALSEIRKARSKQLSEMNGEGSSGEGQGEGKRGKGKGEGKGEGEGEGAGDGEGNAPGGDGPPQIAAPFGPPSGKPGPGGGAGADIKGDPTEMPEASVYAPEHVETDPEGPAQGAVRVIRRFTEGYRDSREYGELHDKYTSIAESAVRQEEIPLTRRDYIRSYFQAVRGQ